MAKARPPRKAVNYCIESFQVGLHRPLKQTCAPIEWVAFLGPLSTHTLPLPVPHTGVGRRRPVHCPSPNTVFSGLFASQREFVLWVKLSYYGRLYSRQKGGRRWRWGAGGGALFTEVGGTYAGLSGPSVPTGQPARPGTKGETAGADCWTYIHGKGNDPTTPVPVGSALLSGLRLLLLTENL